MKHGRLFHLAPMVWILSVALLAVSCITWFWQPIAAYIELSVSVILIVVSVLKLIRDHRDIERYMRRIVRHVSETDEAALLTLPIPVVVVSADGQVLWHNRAFGLNVTDNRFCVGKSSDDILPNVDVRSLYHSTLLDVDVNGRYYRVYASPLSVRGRDMFVLYYTDITKLHLTELEFQATRPIVMLICIDNLEELMQGLRDSERSRIGGKVENALEDWLANTTAILRKIDDDRFVAVLEKRYLDHMIQAKFDILDRVNALTLGNHSRITLSIGVGEGTDFRQAEHSARLALDMALGRGGAQAAIRTQNGFDFYGGLSKDVEKHTKVRTRVMASALEDLIRNSDNVLVMGHRYSDLDCVGSGVTLTCVARALGKPAHLIVARKTTLAEELFVRFEEEGRGDLFIEPADALPLIYPKTLLIVTDTQSPHMLESSDIYDRINSVAVIDHHRKMIGHIDKATLFYHESYASSACEMVSELVQYLNIPEISALEAEALLSGIMLDTRNFVLKAGVRTFEAAAFLRKRGADTVSVKKIFSGSLESYKLKADIISHAAFYKKTAIAFAANGEGSELRIACAQAADELLSVKDTDAAFAMFADGSCVNISARSYGNFNVQLVMEYLGGGGHMTMAGAQLKDVTPEQAVGLLKDAIDRYITETSK